MDQRSNKVERATGIAGCVLWICMTGCAQWPKPWSAAACQSPLAPVINVPQINSEGYLQDGPVIQGRIVAGPPQKSATERAVELTEEVNQLTQRVEALQQNVASLQHQLAGKTESLRAATEEIDLTRSAIVQCQRRIDAWDSEASKLSSYIDQRNRRHDAVVMSLTSRLATLIEQYEAKDGETSEAPNASETVSDLVENEHGVES